MKMSEITALSKEQLIELTKEHIDRTRDLEKKLGDCLGGFTQIENDHKRTFEEKLQTIVGGALQPFFYYHNNAHRWETMQHIFWGFRNTLMDNSAFESYWSNLSFRRAVMVINLAIESLPTVPAKALAVGEDEEGVSNDFDYTDFAAYFVNADQEEHEGFHKLIECAQVLTQEDWVEWDQEPENLNVLKVSLKVIFDCQRIWREIKPKN